MKRNKRLTEAVRIAQNAEIEEFEKQISEDGEHVFSADFEEKMNSLFEKKKEPTAKYQYFKRAAIAFCCLAVVLASAIIIGKTGNSGYYSFADWLGETGGCVYEPAYVPDGYELYAREVTKGVIKTEYRNASGDSIIFEQSKTPFDSEIPFEIQYEGYESSIIEINQRLLKCYRKDDLSIVIRGIPNYFFRVSGAADYEEMIKMCEVKEVVIKK